MNDVYVEMCRTSPVQGEWKPKFGDNTNYGIMVQKDEYGMRCFYSGPSEGVDWSTHFTPYHLQEDMIWLPRQEDYQQMCENSGVDDLDIDKWVHENGEYYKQVPLEGLPLASQWTIRWCLYYHLEVHKLQFNFDSMLWGGI